MSRINLNSLVFAILILSASAFAGSYCGGTGDANAPYLIADVNDLLEISDEPNDWASHFLLTASGTTGAISVSLHCRTSQY